MKKKVKTTEAIQPRNWWCRYCTKCVDELCTAEVPYYARTIDCKFFTENEEVKPIKKHRFSLKRVLVETL